MVGVVGAVLVCVVGLAVLLAAVVAPVLGYGKESPRPCCCESYVIVRPKPGKGLLLRAWEHVEYIGDGRYVLFRGEQRRGCRCRVVPIREPGRDGEVERRR